MQTNISFGEMNPNELDDALMQLEIKIEKAHILLNVLQQAYGFGEEEMSKEQAMNIRYYAKNIRTMFEVISDYTKSALETLKGGAE